MIHKEETVKEMIEKTFKDKDLEADLRDKIHQELEYSKIDLARNILQ